MIVCMLMGSGDPSDELLLLAVKELELVASLLLVNIMEMLEPICEGPSAEVELKLLPPLDVVSSCCGLI